MILVCVFICYVCFFYCFPFPSCLQSCVVLSLFCLILRVPGHFHVDEDCVCASIIFLASLFLISAFLFFSRVRSFVSLFLSLSLSLCCLLAVHLFCAHPNPKPEHIPNQMATTTAHLRSLSLSLSLSSPQRFVRMCAVARVDFHTRARTRHACARRVRRRERVTLAVECESSEPE